MEKIGIKENTKFQNLDENIKTKELRELFAWLMDRDTLPNLDCNFSEVLATTQNDPNIYYPEFITKIIDSDIFQRLNHISQLGSAIEFYPNAFQTRAEHSLGVYENKLEEIYYQSQDLDWKKFIEDNNLKSYLLARLIKNLLHDCGHFPYSHAFEDSIIGKHGVHEEITARLILEDPQLRKIFDDENPEIYYYLKAILERKEYKGLTQELLNNDTLLEEGSIDTDRREFLSDDSMHYGFINSHPTMPFKKVRVSKDKETGQLVKNEDGSIHEDENSESFIYVYDDSNLKDILRILSARDFQYENIYICDYLIQFEHNLAVFFKAFLEDTSPENKDIAKDLRDYLSTFKNCNGDASKIDLETFKSFDEVKFYLNLLDIFENHSNPIMREITLLMIPNLKNFMNLVHHFAYGKIEGVNADRKIQQKDLSKEEMDLCCKIRDLIKLPEKRDSYQKISSIKERQNCFRSFSGKDYQEIINSSDDAVELIEAVTDLYEQDLLIKSELPIRSYKSKEPIYIIDTKGRVFELPDYPTVDSSRLLEKRKQRIYFINIPYLRLMNVDPNTIALIENNLSPIEYPIPHSQQISSELVTVGGKSEKVSRPFNFSPIQAHKNMAEYFSEIERD